MKDNDVDFLGTGWSFPPSFDKKNGTVNMVSGQKDIRQSIQIYFETKIGERILKPEFGSFVHNLIFEQNNLGFLTSIQNRLASDLSRWEPRIQIENIEAKTSPDDDGKILVSVNYSIQETNVRDNIVFPFYLLEGTNVE
ncbi:MAG: GPW/gp25 family protein [Bacteroidota bacterium]|nr:GPW/gp25 family protein [Bacteroidota bacterium]